MLVNVRFGVLYGNGPLLVPPIGLREHAAIDHAEPVVAPEIAVDFGPVAVVANLLWIEHQRAVDSGNGDAVRVVGAAVKNLVLRDEVHDGAACAKSAER